MRCPACQHPDSAVISTKHTPAGDTRRRRCPSCDHRWTTHERIAWPRLGRTKLGPDARRRFTEPTKWTDG
jgi:transcriptional regulator NrdR family protein